MILIAFAAPAESGKTTAANILVESFGFTRVSFAAPLYDMLEAGGFGRPKTSAEKEAVIPGLGFSWRHAAQTLGTEWGRVCLRDSIWTDLAMRKCRDPDGRYVFDDCRFENEAKRIRDCAGHVVHVTGRKAQHVGEAAQQHASEKGLEWFYGDTVLDNSTDMTDLYARLADMLYVFEHQ